MYVFECVHACACLRVCFSIISERPRPHALGNQIPLRTRANERARHAIPAASPHAISASPQRPRLTSASSSRACCGNTRPRARLAFGFFPAFFLPFDSFLSFVFFVRFFFFLLFYVSLFCLYFVRLWTFFVVLLVFLLSFFYLYSI